MQTEPKSPAYQLVFNTLFLFLLICTLLLRQAELLLRLYKIESQEKQPVVFVFNLIRPEKKIFFQPSSNAAKPKNLALRHALRKSIFNKNAPKAALT